MPDDYMSYGSSDSIRKALDRLEDKKVIIRVAQGIYVRPKISTLIGPLTPSAEEVAEAIAKRDRIRTVPTGGPLRPPVLQPLHISFAHRQPDIGHPQPCFLEGRHLFHIHQIRAVYAPKTVLLQAVG